MTHILVQPPGASGGELSPGSRIHVEMAARGRFDLVVVDVRRPQVRAKLLKDVVFHVRAGGAVLVRNAHRTRSLADTGRRSDPVEALLTDLDKARVAGPPDGGERRGVQDIWRLAEAMEATQQVGAHLVVTCSDHRALAKLDEPEMNPLLALRPESQDDVIRTIPAVRFASRCVLRQSMELPDGRKRTPDHYDAPEMSLRDYRGVVCLPGQVVAQGNLLLPDTFRHNLRRRLENRYTTDLGRRFARIEVVRDLEVLQGSYFHLDNEVRGHFGHAMTEQVSRLWGWKTAKIESPDLKVLMAINKNREMRSWEYVLFGAIGIAPEDVVFVHDPVRVERLVSASAMLSMPKYIHPRIAEHWRQMADALVTRAPDRSYPRRIFCSRRIRKRSCHNAHEVEQVFAERGFEVVFPEEYDLPEQVAMFQRAEVVAGFAGSALFSLLFAHQPTRVIIVASESYSARNEYMIASVLGHEIDFVLCHPDIPQPEKGWQKSAFESSFTFDPAREGRFLQDVFDSL